MRHWGPDILLDRRRLITCAAALIVARPAWASLVLTPPQTAGPFYPRVKPQDSDSDLTRIAGHDSVSTGTVIEVTGRILSVKGHALNGAVVEIWQADALGRYADPRDGGAVAKRDRAFQGYGAVKVGADGQYRFRTIKPAAYGSAAFRRTPHIHFRVVTGSGQELVTQMYFPGEQLNAQDFILGRLGDDAARAAATARLVPGNNPQRFAYDVVLA